MNFTVQKWNSKQELSEFRQHTIEQAKKSIQTNEAKAVLLELQNRIAEFKIPSGKYSFHKDGDPVMLMLPTDGGEWLSKEVPNLDQEEQESLWTIAASFLFSHAEGRVAVGTFVMDPESVWSKIGLPSLLLNEKVTHINGRLRETYLNHAIQYGLAEVQHALEEHLSEPAYRPEHLHRALANAALEGICPTKDDLSDLEDLVAGRLDEQEFLAKVNARYE